MREHQALVQVVVGAVCFVLAALFLEVSFGACFLVLLACYALVELAYLLVSFNKDKKEEPNTPCAYCNEPGCTGKCKSCRL